MNSHFSILLIFASYFQIFCANQNFGIAEKEKPIKTVERIFKDYIKYSENVDSQENEDSMKKALQSLQVRSNKKDLPLLINVWMYYDPTDFPARQLIAPIFDKDKATTLVALDKRLKNKKEWEDNETAPYADLIALRKQISEQMR